MNEIDMNRQNDFLIHFGIKGMRWGVRRFQNQDGSLTPEGNERYGDDDSSSGSAPVKKEPDKRKISELSDQELRERINRLNMERQYKQLMDEMSGKKVRDIPQPKNKGNKGGGKSVLNKIFIATAVGVAAKVMTGQYQKIADKALAKHEANVLRSKAAAEARRAAFNTAARKAAYQKHKRDLAKASNKAFKKAQTEAVKNMLKADRLKEKAGAAIVNDMLKAYRAPKKAARAAVRRSFANRVANNWIPHL